MALIGTHKLSEVAWYFLVFADDDVVAVGRSLTNQCPTTLVPGPLSPSRLPSFLPFSKIIPPGMER